MSDQPILLPPGLGNVYDPEYFDVVVVFGSDVIASYFGKDVTLVRNSAGKYTLTLPQKYRRYTRFNWGMLDASGAILFCVMVSHTLTTDGKVVFETRTEAGTATDPATGSELSITLGVSRTVLNDDLVTTV